MDERPELIPSHGNWVEGERFWGRELDLKLFEDRLDEGANLLMVAQRRMGKTSLMREAARRLEGRYLPVFVDFEKARSAANAIVELSIATRDHQPLWSKTRDLFANILGLVGRAVEKLSVSELSVTLRDGLTQGNWESKGDELFEILADSDIPVLLLLDEVPILVSRLLKGPDFVITDERREDTDAFMSWLRSNSQKHQGKVRVVISGSIGLEPVLRQGGLTATLNAFSSFELKAWDEYTVVGCLRALAHGKGLLYEDGVPEAMFAKLGLAIPHHVQLFFNHAYVFCCRRNDMHFRMADIETVYQQEMLSVRGHAELTHYEERLDLILGKKKNLIALELLTEAAVTGALTNQALMALQKIPLDRPLDEDISLATAHREILRVLEHDGYLERKGDRLVFVSNLVRDWWSSRNGFAYIPILDRT